ncbi:hypothetical protein FB451DRAFT_1338652 [Mycena latifolia]|nr:hypothetical protein FB451DRAFT_1338652 [Mycena latifolia]
MSRKNQEKMPGPRSTSGPRLRQHKQSASEKTAAKFAAMEDVLKNSPFETLGDFLSVLFYNTARGEPNPRGTTHTHVVAQFLRGRTNIKMSDILPLMYRHKASFPTSKSVDVNEQKKMFSTSGPGDQINHARPFISTWATRLVAAEARKQVGRATRDDPDDPEDHTRLRARSNSRKKAHVVTWPELLRHFNLKWIESKYCLRLPLPMFLTEFMAAPSSNGVFFVRKRRPHPIIQVGAIASFIISRNRYANGDLAMALGVWHFATKCHIDVKRVYSRFGYCVSDTTARNALNSMSTASFVELRADVKKATERDETDGSLLVDNVQQYCDVYEQGIGRQSQLKVGTAATYVYLEDCAPGAFAAKPYYEKVALQERKTLTTDSLFDDIDWAHKRVVIPLHWTRILVEYAPELQHLVKEIAGMFRIDPIAKHRMREGRQTRDQPLSTNSEREMETPGMARAIGDFDQQVGIDSDNPGNSLSWIRRDGASYATILRLIKYSTPLGTFKNKIATPEIWHTGATDLNSTAANHYGPATSSDPSSLSKSSNIAGLKRPSNIKSCDYYPTVRNLTLIWTAHVLDCWRIFFGADDLQSYLRGLAASKELPSLDVLLGYGMILVDRYATQSAIQISLSASESMDPHRDNKVPVGSPWVAPTNPGNLPSRDAQDEDLPGLEEIIEPETPADPPITPKVPEDAPKIHQERAGFTGDRIWIFKFAGSSHQNYMAYLLEVYCMLRYEASKDLNNAILNNWLVNIKGELGKWLPGDLHQEHYNKWLEDMVQKHGGEFDNQFYRQTISPNVRHFLQIKEEVESAFSLEHRGKTHTSPYLRGELQLLLTTFKEEEVHLFRSGRSLGHAAVNQFGRGWRRLEEEKLGDFLNKSTALGDFWREFYQKEHGELQRDSASPAPSSSGSETSSTISSNSSLDSSASMRMLADIDPNEPDDDGEDLSDVQLSSGSCFSMTVDQDTGRIVLCDEVGAEEEEEGSEDEGGEEVEEEEEEIEGDRSEDDEDYDDEC